MEQIPLTAERRQGTGKGAARKLRTEGHVPAIIYGAGEEPVSLTVAVADLERVLRQVSGTTAFLSVDISGEAPRTAVLQKLQKDHLGRRIMHVDFYQVRADQELVLDVSLQFVGEAKGVSEEGGILNVAEHTIQVKGLITDIPDSVEVDVSDLAIGDYIHAKDLSLPPGATVAVDENTLVVACTPPAQIEVEEASAEEEEAEGEAAEGEEEAAPKSGE